MSKVRLPHPEKGALGNYSTSSAERARHAELNKSVHEHGYKPTVLDLNLRATLNKNQAPGASKIMREDIDYLRQKYRGAGGSRKSRRSKSSKQKSSKQGSRKSRKSRKQKSRKSRKQKSRKSKK